MLFMALLALPQAKAQRWEEAWELLKMKQTDTARMVIDKDAETEPGKNLAMTWYVRGMVYKALYDRDDAQEKYAGDNLDLVAFDAYKKAIALDKNHEITDGILEDILALTEDMAQVGLDLFEKGYDARDGHLLSRSARYLDCVEESFALLGPRGMNIHKMLNDFSLDKRTLDVCRALAKDGSGRKEDAMAIYQKLVNEKSAEPAVYLNMKEYYQLRGKKGLALEVLQAGRKAAPSSLEIACAYSEMLADTNKAQEGIRLVRDLARQYPGEAMPYASAGFIEEKRGNPESAQTYYQKALDAEPNDFLANFRMGKFFFKKAEENKQKNATKTYVKELQETSLHYAEIAAQADPKHPGNTRIMYELYTSLGQKEKAQMLKSGSIN